jgi:phosphatidylglycerophosphatase A
VITRLGLIIASAFGAGYAPFAPGTVGSIAGLVVWALLPRSAHAQGLALVVVLVLGVWSAGVAERQLGRTDPSQVVIDEVLGMLITLFLNDVGWPGAWLGFFLFRIADVVKPYPANRLERLHGGLGIMADDAMAAVYSNLVLRICVWVWGRLNV